MTATKFITFGIGCLLLLPFVWSFILMVSPTPEPSAEEKTFFEKERDRMAAETSLAEAGDNFVMGFTQVTTYKAVTPHPKLAFVWLLASRWWVGIAGLIASLMLIVCLFISSFFPIIVESFGYEHHIQLPNSENSQAWFNTTDFSEGKVEDNKKAKVGD